jgi:hypothetical protein
MAVAPDSWKGFAPTGYRLDWRVLSEMPLIEEGDGTATISTTVGAILQEALPHLFVPFTPDGELGVAPPRQSCEVKRGLMSLDITTPTRTIKLRTLGNATSFAVDLVNTIISIVERSGDKPLHAMFFYYDRDHVIDDPHESFSFFVVNDDRIVLDRVSFSQHHGSGFDPAVFTPITKIENRVWANEPEVQRATVRWWYRRFYEETDAGRFTQLREDIDLYYYIPEWKHRELVAARLNEIARTTTRLQTLLVVLLVAVAIAVLALRR